MTMSHAGASAMCGSTESTGYHKSLPCLFAYHFRSMLARVTSHRVTSHRVAGAGGRTPSPAAVALTKAREDLAAGKSRYPRDYGRAKFPPSGNAVSERGTRWIEDCESIGLRFVGFCDEIGERGHGRINHTGWFLDPDGDGHNGTARGVVYQFPARHGRALYVVGYAMGDSHKNGWSRTDGTSDSACLALSLKDMTEGKQGGCEHDDSAKLQAARDADHYAETMAEEERAYQYVWQLGADYERHREAKDSAASKAKALRAELKTARATAKAAGVVLPEVCRTLRDSLACYRDDIATARDAMARIINDNVFRGNHRGAFMDGASLNERDAKRLGI